MATAARSTPPPPQQTGLARHGTAGDAPRSESTRYVCRGDVFVADSSSAPSYASNPTDRGKSIVSSTTGWTARRLFGAQKRQGSPSNARTADGRRLFGVASSPGTCLDTTRQLGINRDLPISVGNGDAARDGAERPSLPRRRASYEPLACRRALYGWWCVWAWAWAWTWSSSRPPGDAFLVHSSNDDAHPIVAVRRARSDRRVTLPCQATASQGRGGNGTASR